MVVAPGDLNEAKRLDAVLGAARELDDAVHVVLVGRRIEGYDVDRYDGTFVTTYRGNWNLSGTGITQTTLYNANNLPVAPGDPILTFLDQPNPAISYPSGQGNSNIGAGTLPGNSSWVIGPDGISRVVYPGLWKLGVYRTDNNGTLGQPNASSTRPFIIAYFSEFYFVAAEAAVMGATAQAGQSARDLINVAVVLCHVGL